VTTSETKVIAQLSAVPGRCMVECYVPWMCVYGWTFSSELSVWILLHFKDTSAIWKCNV